jgi:lysozyme family protein
MTSRIQQIIDEVIGIEGDGGGEAQPGDAGGRTRWGVTEAAARADGYEGDMADLPRERAVRIFLRNYFYKPGFDQVLLISEPIASELFETEVNLPPGNAVKFLQRALNGLNDPHGKGYPLFHDLAVDGSLGPTTLTALHAFLRLRKTAGETGLLRLQNAQQAVYYMERTEKRPANKAFLFGWVMNRIRI